MELFGGSVFAWVAAQQAAQDAERAAEESERSKPALVARSEQPADGRTRRVSSTAYCLRGTMANGRQVHDGAVAMNGIPFGTPVEVLSGPLAGTTLVVEDRIGHGTEFDVWFSSCGDARQYGRRSIAIRY